MKTLTLTVLEYRELVTALRTAYEFAEASPDDGASDVLDYLNNALEILNENAAD